MSAVAERPAPLARLAAAVTALGGGSRARARRADALARLLTLGLPTPRDGAWKYTNLRLLERRDLAPAPPRPIDAQLLALLPSRPGATLVFVDGRYHAALGSGALPAGVTFTPLATLLDQTATPALDARLGASDHLDDRIRLLNTALAADGGELSVAAGIVVEADVHVVHIASGAGAYPRLLITLAAGSTLRLVEYHLTAGDPDSVAAPVTDIDLAAAAHLEHYSVGLTGIRSIELEDVTVTVARDAGYRHCHIANGAQLARLDLRVRLAGEGSSTALAGLFLADRARQLDVRTLVEHLVPRTTSEQLYRGVATERGRGSYDGKVVVHAGAFKSDSRQSSRNLLLSKEAAIDTRPQLEINADDVKCSHGATTGTLDEQMLFYLLARGLERDTARALLTYAFAADVLARIALPELRRYTEERVLGSLPAAALIREFVR